MLLVSIMTRIICRRIGTSFGFIVSGAVSKSGVGPSQQFRTEHQPGGFGRFHIHPETNTILVTDETNHPSAPGKTLRITNSQDTFSFQVSEYAFQAPSFRRADKKNVASLNVLHPL